MFESRRNQYNVTIIKLLLFCNTKLIMNNVERIQKKRVNVIRIGGHLRCIKTEVHSDKTHPIARSISLKCKGKSVRRMPHEESGESQ